VPSFGDARVKDLLRAARQEGLAPRSDAELLPLLLRLIGAHIPVEAWPTQMTKTQRTGQAREHTQGAAAAADRPTEAGQTSPRGRPPSPATAAPREREGEGHGPGVVPLERARSARAAVDAERRRRREAAVPGRPAPAPLMHDALRTMSIFRIPDDDEPGGSQP
jgi:hypothetical protein